MPSVKVRDNEPFDIALRRFKRACERAGTLAESRKRQFYEKPTQERKEKLLLLLNVQSVKQECKEFVSVNTKIS